MKAQNLIASVAATLFTVATLGAVNYNVDIRQAPVTPSHYSVTNLPAIVVHPSAAEWRAAALSNADGITATHAGGYGGPQQFSLSSSQLAMPYYSFANQFGGIVKE